MGTLTLLFYFHLKVRLKKEIQTHINVCMTHRDKQVCELMVTDYGSQHESVSSYTAETLKQVDGSKCGWLHFL